VPDPSAVPPAAGAQVPKLSLQFPGLVLAKRNQPLVALSRGVGGAAAQPAAVPLRPLAATARAVGVVKLTTAPNEVPSEFEAIAQKQ